MKYPGNALRITVVAGMKVENPTRGLYIRSQGSKACKILIR